MPLIGERQGGIPGKERLFVFLDGLEFIAGTEAYAEFLEPLLAFGSYRYYKNRLDESRLLLERIRGAHAVFLDWSNLDAEVLEACGNLEIVSYIGVGAANFVDIEAATARGIVVTNTPDYGNRSVAEHALGLALAVARHVARGDRDLRRGEWTSAALEGVQLAGRSVGLVGMGAVGSEMARLCHALGMRVYYHDPCRRPEMEDIAAWLGLDDLLSICDLVSLHVALTPETRGLIGEREIALMRPDAILVNTSRGEVLDLSALAAALREKRLRGAGLDNYPGEPRPDLRELVELDNVVLTPHIAFNTREAKDRMTAIAVENVVAFYRGEPRNVMNPAALRPR
ncbi:MAG: NAD(P)-dependent oxidoreductase [Actinomycetota bacterium]|nr:NAD(P)-dependent oxidoreductase [Actinomycetota bacterium]